MGKMDSSVLLDVIVDDRVWASQSGRALSEAMQAGSLVIGELVLAEVVPALGVGLIGEFLPDFLIGAPASCHADRLLARDRCCFHHYFHGLKVIG